MDALNILLLSFLIPFIGVIGALCGLHLGSMIFGPINIRLNKEQP